MAKDPKDVKPDAKSSATPPKAPAQKFKRAEHLDGGGDGVPGTGEPGKNPWN